MRQENVDVSSLVTMSYQIPDRHASDLTLFQPVRPEQTMIDSLLEEFREHHPVRSLFQAGTGASGRQFRSGTALSSPEIDHLIEQSSDEAREFINEVYENWISDVKNWVEDVISLHERRVSHAPCLLLLRNSTEKPLYEISIDISCENPFTLQRDLPAYGGSESHTPPIPPKPVLTRAMCVNFSSLGPDELLKAYGYQLDDATFVSPMVTSELSDDEPFTARQISDRILSCTFPLLEPGETVRLPLLFTCTDGDSGEAAAGGLRLYGNSAAGNCETIIPVQLQKRELLPVIENLLLARHPTRSTLRE